ncbi:MAG TPA: ABC transporter ATP-binding protein [Oscillatoriaceae cyanobacterium]
MIRVEQLEKRYGKRLALAGVDLTVAPGEIVALLGPNGAGKSTLLKALVGLLHPTGGRIWLDGMDLARHPREVLARIGYVPQRVGFPRHLRVREVLAYYAQLKRLDATAVKRAMARVGLSEQAERPVGELSGGTLQRLGLASAILADPPLLVLDEPTVGLDPQVSCEFCEALTALNAAGVTVILTSHLLGEVERLAHRVAILKEGRLVAQGSVPELLTASGLPSALYLQPSHEPLAAGEALAIAGVRAERAGTAWRLPLDAEGAYRALDMLHRRGVPVSSLWTTTPTLEEVFRWVVEKETR